MTRRRTMLAGLALLVVPTGCAVVDSGADGHDAITSAVGIEAEGCGLRPAVASGAVLERAGLVVTVAHAVAGSRQVTVIDHEAQRLPATLRYLDPESDIAILYVAGLVADPLPVTAVAPPTDAVLLVYDGDDGLSTTEVMVTKRLNVTIEDIYIDAEVQRSAVELEGSVSSGDSGGMVVVDGSVVAMVYARSRNSERGFAVDERELGDALATLSDDEPPSADFASIESGRCVP